MGLTFYNGTITSTTSEANLFDITGNAHYATYIYLHNMASGDTVVIRTYVKDVNATTMRLYKPVTISGAQTADPTGFLAFMAATQYKVTIQRTAGSDRAYTWLRVEVT
jgi:hypothetical protein